MEVTRSIGDLELEGGALDKAAAQFGTSLALATRLGVPRGQAYAAGGLACVMARTGDIEKAGQLWAAVEATEEANGLRLMPPDRRRYERLLQPASRNERFQVGVKVGRELGIEAVIAEQMPGSARPTG